MPLPGKINSFFSPTANINKIGWRICGGEADEFVKRLHKAVIGAISQVPGDGYMSDEEEQEDTDDYFHEMVGNAEDEGEPAASYSTR